MAKNPSRSCYLFFKRVFDFILASLLIVVLFPLFLFIGIWVFIASPGRVIFAQKRYGRNGKLFRCLKFRTMKKNAPDNISARSIDHVWAYFIHGGGFLRKTGLDELPQLFNIWVGQMSFVGPRPCITSENDLYLARKENGALSVRPGLTGYAQVHDRSLVNDLEKAKLDGYYVANISFGLDWRIFWGTFKILFAKGQAKK
jgi:O-antigen biosynthesis protein WbqP